MLCTIIADAMTDFIKQIEAGAKPEFVAQESLRKHWNVIFNGNGYSDQWPIEARKRGLFECPSGVEAISRLGLEKNLKVFEEMKVLTRAESMARMEVMHDHYSGLVEMEASCMIDMFKQYILPVAEDYAKEHVAPIKAACASVEAKLVQMHDAEEPSIKAGIARELKLSRFARARQKPAAFAA